MLPPLHLVALLPRSPSIYGSRIIPPLIPSVSLIISISYLTHLSIKKSHPLVLCELQKTCTYTKASSILRRLHPSHLGHLHVYNKTQLEAHKHEDISYSHPRRFGAGLSPSHIVSQTFSLSLALVLTNTTTTATQQQANTSAPAQTPPSAQATPSAQTSSSAATQTAAANRAAARTTSPASSPWVSTLPSAGCPSPTRATPPARRTASSTPPPAPFSFRPASAPLTPPGRGPARGMSRDLRTRSVRRLGRLLVTVR